jgi:acyl carrier protein
VTLPRSLARAAARALDGARSGIALREATRVGSGVRVFGWPRVANEGELVVGMAVALVSSPSAVNLLVGPGGSLVIGDRALIESGAAIRARGRVRIGGAVRIGAGCIVDDEGGDDDEISIGDGAWLEDGAVLLGGAHVAAGAVVPRGVPGGAANGAPPAPVPSSKESDGPTLDADAREVDRRIRAVLGRLIFGASNVDRSASLAGVKGWDSLAALRVLVALEKEFAVVLPSHLFAQNPSLESVTPVILATVAKRAEAG